MGADINFTEVKSEQDYMNMVYSALYTKENIEAAGGIDKFNELVEKGKKRQKLRSITSKINCFIEFFGSKLLAISLIIAIIIVTLKIL